METNDSYLASCGFSRPVHCQRKPGKKTVKQPVNGHHTRRGIYRSILKLSSSFPVLFKPYGNVDDVREVGTDCVGSAGLLFLRYISKSQFGGRAGMPANSKTAKSLGDNPTRKEGQGGVCGGLGARFMI